MKWTVIPPFGLLAGSTHTHAKCDAEVSRARRSSLHDKRCLVWIVAEVKFSSRRFKMEIEAVERSFRPRGQLKVFLYSQTLPEVDGKGSSNSRLSPQARCI